MLGKKLSYQTNGSTVEFEFEHGTAYVTAVTDTIMNVFVPYQSKDHRSKAIEGDKRLPVTVDVSEEGGAVQIKTDKLTAKVYDDFLIDFYKKDGTLLCADFRGERKKKKKLSDEALATLESEGHVVSAEGEKEDPVMVVKQMSGDEKFYGLGDKTGVLNKRNYEYENWNSDLPQAHTDDFKALYKSIPFLITLKDAGVFGMFFDNTYRSHVNLGKENSACYYYSAENGNLDYYFISGEKMTDIVEGYTYLTGRTPLPQLWTLGHHQSRWGYMSADDQTCGTQIQRTADSM